MVTYVNDLRLSELATGEGSGTWGTTTNTNLELIGEALGYGTEQSFSSDADATTTIGDGVSDPARAMYFKVTSAGSLTATRTLTIAPNTVSRVMFIENATTGSQSIAISQGSGANVTIATGKTAVVYLDGAGSGAAVVDAMAGVDPGVTDTLAEVLTAGNTTGGTDLAVSTGDDITFADSSKAIFGAGSDLQIYHDGSNSYIDESATGSLLIRGSNLQLRSYGTNEYFFTGVENGASTIYYDGLNKLATTATGIDVTGGFTATAASTITTADNSTQLTLISTDADSAVGPVLDLFRNSASPGNFDLLGKLVFSGEDDGGNKTEYAHLQAYPQTITGGAESGYFEIHTLVGGTDRSRIEANATEVSINPTGIDSNFRVRSGNNTNALFLEGSNSFVGLSTNEPLEKLQIDDGNIVIYNTGVSSSVNATIGHISGRGRVGSTDPLARISFGTDAVYYHGVMDFQLADDYAVGALETRLKLYTDEAVFNEAGSNVDFRVESDNLTHAFFVEGGTGQLRVNTANWPSNTFGDAAGRHIVGGSNEPLFVLWNEASVAANNISTLAIGAKSATATTAFGGGWIRGGLENNSDSDGFLGFYTTKDAGANAEQLRISSSGAATFSSSVTALQGIFTQTGGDFAATFSTPFDYVAKFISTDSAAFIVLQDSNSTDNYNRIGAVGDSIQIESGNVENALFTSTASVFNENSVDMDFRVESDGNANMLFVDGGLNIVSVGSSSVYQAGALEVFAQSDASSQGVSINGASSATSFRLYTVGNVAKIGRGGDNPAISISSGNAVTINENSLDVDFRVESDNNANMLFIDANTNYVLIGKDSTSSTADGHAFSQSGTYVAVCDFSGVNEQVIFNQQDATGTTQMDFRNGNVTRGYIEWTNSGTTYNTSSDRRMKENIADADDAGSSIDAIQVRKFDWIDDGSHQPYGMIAQELISIAPDAVSGSEDSEKMMAVDYSRLVPMLIKEIQSLRARVADLES